MMRRAVALLLFTVATGSTASARPVPFHATIGTVITPAGFCGQTCVVLDISGAGQAGHMGRVAIDGPTSNLVGTVSDTGRN